MVKITLDEAYEILSVDKSTSDEDIKAAYRRLALQTHPDKNRDDPVAHQKFLKVSEAYRKIVDPCDVLDEGAREGNTADGYYEDEDYETMFAFRMFERMFSQSNLAGFAGASRRNTCNCWECKNSKNFFIPKPQTKYIPKSQRPKDPLEEEKKKNATAVPINPHENWLSDEDKPASKSKKSVKKIGNSGPKKKRTKENY